ncbi:myosin heavy chain, cardiac muscle isoform-like isoform X2 [Symsagittifera roscoffensis]|uniref:myosin heavy chain, cardiac muscle isoform-like isoform X2 n=1 Tax=Symsagittifera roscoffensis TaxID=84072 RepID=UPI00307CC108
MTTTGSVPKDGRSLKLPRTMATSKGSLVLMPQGEDNWLFGKDSDYFRTSQWKRRGSPKWEKEMDSRREEALKALTATIVDYGPDARKLMDFLQTFTKSHEKGLNQPGAKPDEYLKNLQKQLNDSLQLSVKNMTLDAEMDQTNFDPRTQNSGMNPFEHNATTSGNLKHQKEEETTDFSSADTVLKNFTLFIPEHLLQGTKFMRRLNLGEKEVVRYSVKSGKKIDKLLFEDLRSTKSSKQRGVRFDEERYNASVPMPDTSMLSSLGSRASSKYDSRMGSTKGVRFTEEENEGQPPEEKEEKDIDEVSEKTKDQLESQPEGAKSRLNQKSRNREPVYNSFGYLKRTRREPSMLIRQRRDLLEQNDAIAEESSSQQQSIYGDMFIDSMRAVRDLERLGEDAKYIMEYVQQWQKDQKEKVVQEAREAIAAANANRITMNNQSPKGSRTASPTHARPGLKKSKHRADNFSKDKSKQKQVKHVSDNLKDNSDSKNKSYTREIFDLSSSDEMGSDLEAAKESETASRVRNLEKASRNTELENLKKLTSHAVRSQAKKHRTGKSSGKKGKKNKQCKTPEIIDSRELSVSEQITKYEEERRKKILDLEIKQDSVEIEIRSLLSDLDDLKRELQIVLEETAKVDQELSEEEDEQKYCLQTELEQQLDMCRMKLEAERDALWQLRRERSRIEREIMLEDVESPSERDNIVAEQEGELGDREVEEEAAMEEQWEHQRKSIMTSYGSRQSQMESALESVRTEKMTPLLQQRSALEEKMSELERALKDLDTKQSGFSREIARLNNWYEEELQKLREQLQSAEDEYSILSGRQSRLKSAVEIGAEQQRRVKMQAVKGDNFVAAKSGEISEAFVYSYFPNIPNDVWNLPFNSKWAKLVRSASEIPAVKESRKK